MSEPSQKPSVPAPNSAPNERRRSTIGDPLRFLSGVVEYAIREHASDIHLRVGNRPTVRLDGALVPLRDRPVLSVPDMETIGQTLMNPRLWDGFQEHYQQDFSIDIRGVGRLRVNVFYQRSTIAMALRVITSDIPTPRELSLPETVERCVHAERGLVLLTGATGSGKSTTIASLINEVNLNYSKHIVTIEDPIEFLFTDRRSIVSQRELGVDAVSFADAMSAALREDPDVILLGEMRDAETIETALTAAETGHLVFSTLHAPAAADTITRIISSFPPEGQPTIRAKLSQNLRAVIAQRLLPRASGSGRVVACEVLTVNARVRELILDPLTVKGIADLVKKGSLIEGMLSFDQHLYELTRRGEISEDIALRHSSSPTDLKLLLEGFLES